MNRSGRLVERRKPPIDVVRIGGSSLPGRTGWRKNCLDEEGLPDWYGPRLERGRAMSLAGSTPAPSALLRSDRRKGIDDGVRGVAVAHETVDLKAPGSIPAEYPAEFESRGVLLGEQ